MTSWVRGLAAAFLFAVLAVVGAPMASAAPFNPCQIPPEPAMPRTGAAGLVSSEPSSIPDRAPDPFADPSVPIADVYGWSWRFDTYDLGCGVDIINDAGWAASNHTANLVLGIDAAGLALLGGLEEMAGGSSLEWLTEMAGVITEAIAPLVAQVWLPITVALVGVWVVWHARRSRYADAFGSLLLALAAVAVSAVAFVAPDALARGADQVVLSVQTATADTVTRSGSSTDLIVRESLYRSWLVGQFGHDGTTAQKYGPRLFDATHYSWSDVKEMREDSGAATRLRGAKQKAFTELAAELEREDPAAYVAFRGRTDRTGPAVLAWVVGIATGLYVWTCLAMILLCRVLMQALAVTVPLMAVVGILPMGWGFLQSAWDRFTAALIGVAKFTLASGVMTIVLGAVMGAPLSTPQKLLWIVLLSIVGFVVTKPFYTLKTITPGLDPNVHYLARAIGLASGVKWLTTEVSDDAPPAAEEAKVPMAAPVQAQADRVNLVALPAVHHPERPALDAAPVSPGRPADDSTGTRSAPRPPGPRSPSGTGGDDVVYPTGVIVQTEGVYRADGRVEPMAEYVKLPEPTLDEQGRVRDDLTYRSPASSEGSRHG